MEREPAEIGGDLVAEVVAEERERGERGKKTREGGNLVRI